MKGVNKKRKTIKKNNVKRGVFLMDSHNERFLRNPMPIISPKEATLSHTIEASQRRIEITFRPIYLQSLPESHPSPLPLFLAIASPLNPST